MEISNTKAALIQFAFYAGYSTMAIQAASFVKKFSYKKGILFGLTLCAVGALLFYSAAQFEIFGFFLVSLYMLNFGLAFLETTANPYILSLGDEETATRRLNLAQSCNPVGSLFGMFVASKFILSLLESDVMNEAGELVFNSLSTVEKATIRAYDMDVIRDPYVMLRFVVFVMLIIIALTKMPVHQNTDHPVCPIIIFTRLMKNVK